MIEQKGFNDIVERLEHKPFNCVALFVDNSGFDVVLGVLPLVIELLKNETTKV